MAGLQLSGLASGLDWQSLVDKLIEAERAPETRLRVEQTTATQRSTVLGTIKTQLADLQTSMKALAGSGTDLFAARTAAFSETDSGWTASAGANTEAGSHTFEVLQLATRAKSLGIASQGKPLSATSDVSGLTLATLSIATPITAGEFTVNGARMTIATTDSLQDVFTKISTATGNAVTASYDLATDKVKLSGTGEVVVGSANDSSNILSALGLFNNGTATLASATALGAVGTGKSLANANLKNAVTAVDAGGNGTFSINGVSIAYNANTDSLNAIMARINSSTAGVTASYDRVNDRFTLANKTTGDTGLAVNEAAGGLLGALGLTGGATLARGKNAQFTVDGGPAITSISNTFDGTLHGLAGLSITATSESSQTVRIAADTTGVRTKFEDFVAKYNAVQDYLDKQTATSTTSSGAVSTSLFSGNREISGVASSLRSQVFNAVPGLSGSIQRLEAIGIDFKSGSSKLEVKDSAKLDDALNNHPDDVKALIASEPNGLVARINTYINQISGDSGTIAVQSNTLTKRAKDIDTQIADMERRIAQQKQLLTDSFIRMESAQQTIKSQLSSLNSALGLNSSSS